MAQHNRLRERPSVPVYFIHVHALCVSGVRSTQNNPQTRLCSLPFRRSSFVLFRPPQRLAWQYVDFGTQEIYPRLLCTRRQEYVNDYPNKVLQLTNQPFQRSSFVVTLLDHRKTLHGGTPTSAYFSMLPQARCLYHPHERGLSRCAARNTTVVCDYFTDQRELFTHAFLKYFIFSTCPVP